MFGYGLQHPFDAVFPEGSDFPKRFSHLHNDFLTHGVGGGIVAVVLLCLVVGMPAWAGWQPVPNASPTVIHQRRQIGTLASLIFFGAAFANNVFFVGISTFMTALSLVAVLVIIEAIATPAVDDEGGIPQDRPT